MDHICPKKGSYFHSKTDKIDTNIEFSMLNVVFVLNFSLNKPFWIFGPNLLKKDLYGQKQKNEHNHWILLIQVSLGTKFHLKLTALIFLPDLPRKSFSGLKQKKWRPHIFYIILHTQTSLVQNFSSNWKIEHHHEILHISISLGIKFQLKLIVLSFLTKFIQKKGIFRRRQNKQSKDYKRLLFV